MMSEININNYDNKYFNWLLFGVASTRFNQRCSIWVKLCNYFWNLILLKSSFQINRKFLQV